MKITGRSFRPNLSARLSGIMNIYTNQRDTNWCLEYWYELSHYVYMQIVFSALKAIYGKQRSRLTKEATSLGRHMKHNLIMSKWLKCSLEGTYNELIPFRKVLLLKRLWLNYSINSSHFAKIDGSLPCSEQT
jgi:hypothetical protein